MRQPFSIQRLLIDRKSYKRCAIALETSSTASNTIMRWTSEVALRFQFFSKVFAISSFSFGVILYPIGIAISAG